MRYYALVLVGDDVPEDEACDAAFDLLSPFILTDSEMADSIPVRLRGHIVLFALGAPTGVDYLAHLRRWIAFEDR